MGDELRPPVERWERDRYPGDVPFWMSIEVFDGAHSAAIWAEAWGDTLSEAALGHGAVDWSWSRHSWGVVLELAFADEGEWERFRESDALRAALDNAPDPKAVIVYKGRGGSAGRTVPRRPRPLSGSGAAALPVPIDFDDLERTVFGRLGEQPLRLLVNR